MENNWAVWMGWTVDDKLIDTKTIAIFEDGIRALEYTKWKNSQEEDDSILFGYDYIGGEDELQGL